VAVDDRQVTPPREPTLELEVDEVTPQVEPNEPPSEPVEKPTGWARRLWWIHSIYALGLGIFIAVYAGREFTYARWLLLSVIAVWTMLVLIYRTFGHRPEVEDETLVKKVGFHAMTWVLKNLYQGMLFFLLPFYWRSTTFGTANQWFLLILGACALLATLDILFDRLLIRFRFASTTYFIVTMFATLNLAIPALITGVDAFYALVGASVISVVVVWLIHVPRWKWADVELRIALVAGLVGAIVVSYVARPLIPPVPHHILHGAVGPGSDGQLTAYAHAVEVKTLEGLLAETRILAPGGAESSFRHEWMQGSTVVHVVEEPGRVTFATNPNELLLRSTLPVHLVPKDAMGEWSVDVRTDSGRLIGRVSFRVFSSAIAP
jgi:hypothetical protein